MPIIQLLLGLFAASGFTAIVGQSSDGASNEQTDTTETQTSGQDQIASAQHVSLKPSPGKKPNKPNKSEEQNEQVVQAPQEQPQPEEVPETGQDVSEQTSPNDPVVPEPEEVPEIGQDVSEQTSPSDPVVPGPKPLLGEVEVMTGRVSTLELPNAADLTSVRILDLPSHGNITVNPDNTLALVLTGETYTGALEFRYEATLADGSTVSKTATLNAVPGLQAEGWGEGDFYMLQTDANDDVVVEAGEVHRKVYVSGNDDALTLRDIAALEGMNYATTTTEQWRDFLAENTDYGSVPGMALAEDAADVLWKDLHQSGDGDGNSHWLLFERGYSYDEMTLLWNGAQGESELHPVLIGAYGDGARPVIDQTLNSTAETENLVIQGLEFTQGIRLFNKTNTILDDIVNTGAKINLSDVTGFTLHNSDIYDAFYDAPVNDGDTWAAHPNRQSGMYMTKSEAVLLEGTFFDHNGWADGYDPGLSADDPHPPSKYSHNIYLAHTNEDITVRDSIIMRGAANGLQLRSGGVMEDNIFIDNNGALMFGRGGELGDGGGGNYSLALGNVVTSAAHKETDGGQGVLSAGITNQGHLATMVDNIVTHLADPNNPDEMLYKLRGQEGLKHKYEDPVYGDSIVYNWVTDQSAASKTPQPDLNVEGLNTAILDQTTIQNFAADLLGKPTATIADLADYLRAQGAGTFDDVVDADLIIAFFRAGFGIEADLDSGAETMRFVPSDIADGVRWDMRMNWDKDYLPGQNDSVELGGNWVSYGGTTTLRGLDLGSGGRLSVDQGYLAVTNNLETGERGGAIEIDRAGQFWTDGYSDTDTLTLAVDGGRFANTGDVEGNVDLFVSDNGQAILATDRASYEVGAGNTLQITGDDTRVGFDGTGSNRTAALTLDDDARLSFVAEDGGLGTISEFRSGFYDHDDPDLISGVQLGGSTLALDITDMGGALARETLLEADEILGAFDTLEITGLGSARDAKVQIDYEKDIVRLLLSADGDGTGVVNYETIGLQSDTDLSAAKAEDIWAALTDGHGTVPEDMPPDLPEDAEIYLFN